MQELEQKQIERYSRHILLQEVGYEGQLKLLQSKVLIVGAGGLGSPTAMYLAASGIGTIGIIDADYVDLTNLQRQIIHHTSNIDKPKVDSAKARMNEINPDVHVKTYQEWLTPGNAFEIIKDYDFVIDGTDSFSSKYLINDACVMAQKPFSHGGILRFEGQTFTYVPGSACYRCIYPSAPDKGDVPSCSQAGVLGSIAGMLGTIQASEALKYILGKGDLLTNRLLLFDALSMSFNEITLQHDSDCLVSGKNPSITELVLEEDSDCKLQ
ncbi:MAG: HesA/MoeB/ThiF family protein [Bacteroidales bacterium]|jgi:molybdopterin/thiamine biosynthesis adenylyltransferase|nr:HesA/MoeB/ThiF family protein [Bacteroidales bacterium]